MNDDGGQEGQPGSGRMEEGWLSVHIFAASASMVGVCLAVIGLFQIVARLGNVESLGDDLLAFDALLFLTACVFAYLALRSRYRGQRRRLERSADALFLLGLGLMAFVCLLITYAIR
ncbi:MAG: hypothetical protein H7145_00205 [Akkermansiaceae bacterium]|nr:hypothetical protein [Armatimonadota bacterium]